MCYVSTHSKPRDVREEALEQGVYVHLIGFRVKHVHLLDITRQLACMKLGRREKYQPIQYCWAGCRGDPVHTCHLPIDIQQIYCSAQTGQHSRLRHSCCPVWALQHICTCTYTVHSILCSRCCVTLTCTVHVYTFYMYMYMYLYMYMYNVHEMYVHVHSIMFQVSQVLCTCLYSNTNL